MPVTVHEHCPAPRPTLARTGALHFQTKAQIPARAADIESRRDCADELIDVIMTARKIVLFGCGREGLQMRGLATRLFHLGRDATVWGDMSMAYRIAGGDAGGSHPVPAGCCSPPSCIHAQSR
jgi:hypothetical protein